MLGALIAKHKVRSAFSYFNDRNMEKFLSLWDDNAIFIYPGNVSVSGTNKGKSTVSAWFNNLMDVGPSVNFSIKSICVDNIFDLIGTNVITVEWDNSVTNRKGINILVSGVSVIRIKKGRIIYVRDYIFDPEKLPIAWCEEV
ncbi:MAG: nuclear transport factor 2 family protein [Gammaproteobacteria bacterium]|nr:nuclear transport factor 2 family protein [Gammaproteobacteria bacterium]